MFDVGISFVTVYIIDSQYAFFKRLA